MTTDLYFYDVVIESRKMQDGWRATCRSCSTVHKAKRDEFKKDNLFNLDGSKVNTLNLADKPSIMLEYVAEMRAWHCCHEDEEPYDGLPEAPEPPLGIEWED